MGGCVWTIGAALAATGVPPAAMAQSTPPAPAPTPVPPADPRPADAPPAAAQSVGTAPDAAGGEIVVVGRRTPADPPPQDVLSADDVATFGADSVGEVLARVRQRIGRDSPPVIVNGRRLGGIGDILALPPEAIDRIEVLPPAAGAQRGFGGNEPVVNLVLRKQFRSGTVEARAAATLHGDADTQEATLRLASIRGERRDNGALTLARTGGLRFGDRFDPATLALAPAGTTARTSLIGAGERAQLQFGHAEPLDDVNLNLSVGAGLYRNRRTVAPGAAVQRSAGENLDLSAQLSGNAGQRFWSLMVSGNVNTGRSDSDPAAGGAAPPGGARSQGYGLRVFALGSSPLFRIAGNQANLTLNLGVTGNRSIQRTGTGTAQALRLASGRSALQGQAGVLVPLHSRSQGPGLLGDLSVMGQLGVDRSTGSDWLLGYTTSVNWSPVALLSFEWTRNVAAAGIGGPVAPLLVESDVAVFDPARQQDVRIRRVSGGNPALVASSLRSTSLRVALRPRLGKSQWMLAANYDANRVTDPVWTPTLDLITERAFPERFVRDAAGRLVAFDTRPLNARSQDSGRIGVSLHASGDFAAPAAPASAPSAAVRQPLHWDLGLTHQWTLRSRLVLRDGLAPVDLASAQLGAGGGDSGRSLSVQAGLAGRGFGANLDTSWRSGTQLLGQGGGAPGRYDNPWRVNFTGFVQLRGGAGAARRAPAWRLSLAVENLLDARPRVRFPDRPTPFALLPASLDPQGRTVRLTLRAPLF